MGGDAGLVVEGAVPLAAAAAVVVGAAEVEGAEEADEGAVEVGVVGGSVVAVRARYARSGVAVFFVRGAAGRPWRRPGG